MPALPMLFLERLKTILPEVHYESVTARFTTSLTSAIRVNLLKIDLISAQNFLTDLGIHFIQHPSLSSVLIVSSEARRQLREASQFREGLLYWQAPSSILPVAVLDPQAKERILDFCAAPGSKTTQIAAQVQNRAEITAIEAIKGRFYKLKTVVSMMGANVHCVLMDARRFKPNDPLFDRVLVDAPCSSEGRFDIKDKESIGYWSLHKIKEMAHKQKGLLLSASRCVKPGGVLVYSTCTLAPEENEAVVDWFLRKTKGYYALQTFELPGVSRYPALIQFQERQYKYDLSSCWRVLPDNLFSAFFIAKFVRIQND